jgi:predicted Zn-dependent protease
MLTHSRPAIAFIIVTALLLPTLWPSSVAAHGKPSVSTGLKHQDKDKKEKSPKDQKDALSKQERKWVEVFQFSKQRYETNPEFRQEVEEGYRRMQREHSEYAFSINVRDPKAEQVMIDEDKVKIKVTLYDNPLAQDYINRVGQSLVPAGSDKLYAFKIILNPIPEARSLSTGTIYVSTGLLSSIDNEAQLAYVLGHEIAHVEKEHWKDDVLVAEGLEDWNEKQQQKKEKIDLISKVGLGIATGGLWNSGNFGAASLAMFANSAMPTILKVAMPGAVVSWDRQQEDQADEIALQYMLNRKYDPREVPKFYAKLKGISQRDKRAGLGFIASAARIAEREPLLTGMIAPMLAGSPSTMLFYGAVSLNTQEQINQSVAAVRPEPERKPDTGKALDPTANSAARERAATAAITGEYAAKIKELLDAGDVIGSSAEFQAVMAAIRRDNGIRAYYYDMFQMARENLEESIRIRSNDPYAHYYYGKVLKLTARSLGEKSRAFNEFALAVQYDKRKVLAEPYLYRALAMLDNNKESETREIVDSLKEYVQLYQRQHSGALPANIDLIYDYLQDAGETSWKAIPAMNVSTKDIDPIGVTSSAQQTPVNVPGNITPPNQQTPSTLPAVAKPTKRRP